MIRLALAAFAAAGVTAPPVNFPDPTGDAGSAPDITNVAVTNDDHGQYTFTIGFATPYANNAIVAILLDTDRNAATGDSNNDGADYLFEDDYGSHFFELESWSANTWQAAANSTASVSVANDNKSVTMSVNKSDLGGSTSFTFYVVSADGDFTRGHTDYAPNLPPDFSYTLQTVFALTTGSYRDGAAKAGGTWTVSLTAVRSDNGQAVTSGASVSCSAKEGTRPLPLLSSSFGGSGAVCTFSVPKKPKHATVTAKVTITDAGQLVTKTFTATTH